MWVLGTVVAISCGLFKGESSFVQAEGGQEVPTCYLPREKAKDEVEEAQLPKENYCRDMISPWPT